MNKMLKKRIMIVVCIVSILITSVSSLVAFGGKNAKADSYEEAHMKKYQNYLNTHYNMKLKEDGHFGCKTAQATVKVIQKLYNEVYKTNLEVDGKWGPKTEAAVNSHRIYKGTNNKIVEFFQVVYNYCWLRDYEIPIDGGFGPKTAQAIESLYKDNYETFGDHPKSPHIFGRVWTYMLEPCCGWFYGCPLTGI